MQGSDEEERASEEGGGEGKKGKRKRKDDRVKTKSEGVRKGEMKRKYEQGAKKVKKGLKMVRA